ncbi:FAD-binding oxidoreductase [Fodinicurvata sp. EGI_FJ10296]|uniref:NAD(P)/FAD-dependent oxidoreductase n=1 Tax=Fodinicurvata sp. EGI_FJ10296 TaxID=3231908 RepID=UPI0034542C3D
MIRNELAASANSLWHATANASLEFLRLEERARADVAIIGGGFTGLSAALHLVERGVKVALVEAEHPGWGASGRNGGQVIPGLKDDPETIVKRWGPELGPRLVRFVGGAPDVVFDLVHRYAIDCDASRAGWIQPAHSASGLETAKRRAEEWRQWDADVDVLSAADVASLVGTDAYVGGLIDRRGGGIHPLNFALGMAAAARRAGVSIYGRSKATSIEKSSEGMIVRTPGGQIAAGHVLVCTNAYTDGLAGPLARSVVPVRSVQVATRPLSENVRASILPEGHVASDTRRLLMYFRLDRDGRLLMGGRGAYSENGTRKQQENLRRATKAMFPQIGDVEWDYFWGGFVAMTRDHLPHLHEIRPGVTAALGYNGRGVAMATAMGRVLADRALGVEDRDLDFPVTGVSPIPFYGFRKPLVSALAAWYRLRDGMGR